MRLFTGIDLPEHVHDKLERFLAALRPTAHLIWSPVYNLHITTKFIGEWPEEKLGEVTTALRQSWNRRGKGLALPKLKSFIAEEEESLVVAIIQTGKMHWASHVEAKLVLSKRRGLYACPVIEEII